jgi:beta-phosphoglucomutase-like phosphatase (HAD superfamily)
MKRLFVPFTDLTSGAETYPAGRYMELDPTPTGIYVVDFNIAYHPYCYYNSELRLPVPAEGKPAGHPDSRRRKDAKGRQQHSMSKDGNREPGAGSLQAIIFDFDGVIADSERLHLRSYQEILAPEGITMSNEDYFDRYLGYDDEGVFKAIGRDQGRGDGRASRVGADRAQGAEVRIARRVRRDALSRRRRLHPRRVAAPVPIAIASGALTHEIEDVLDRAGLLPLFPVIVGADQTERSKPTPEPYQAAFARLRAHTGRDLIAWRSVAIEDSRWGLVSARGADLRCVAVTNTIPKPSCAPTPSWSCRASRAYARALDALCATETHRDEAARGTDRRCRRSPGPDLAAPAFLVARIEYPRLVPGPYLDRLDQMGDAAFHFVAKDPGHDAPVAARIDAINRYLFGELGFSGQPRAV